MASHLRRNATITNAAETIKLLYAILKQCELKNIDWQDVANELNIPQGHAARMRYTRFKQHQDGDLPARKGARATSSSDEPKKERRKKKEAVRAGKNKKAKKEEEVDNGGEREEGGEGGVKVKPENTEESTETPEIEGGGMGVGVVENNDIGTGMMGTYDGSGEMDAHGEVDYGYIDPGFVNTAAYGGSYYVPPYPPVPVKSEVHVKEEPVVGGYDGGYDDGYGAGYGSGLEVPTWPVDASLAEELSADGF